MLPFAYLRVKPKVHLSVIASQHFDGGLAAKLFECFGFQAIRGSSKRGGVGALIEAIKRLKGGEDIGITPDGTSTPQCRRWGGGVGTKDGGGGGGVPCGL
ncbi:hypothetical protein NHP21005_06460 [Helicobacter sp. NHP21005]|nr:hypothetical protein NHP21005_06460 [Helicobacter sp. NHP21005]